jgi:hypothetical protein
MNTMNHAGAGRRVGPAAGRAGGGGAAVMLLALALLSAPAAVRAEPDPQPEREPEHEPERMTAEALMQTYLACDRASMAGRLGLGEIWRCSVVYETLKRRVFGGDFERLRAWSRSQPPLRSATGGSGQVDRGGGAGGRGGRGG